MGMVALADSPPNKALSRSTVKLKELTDEHFRVRTSEHFSISYDTPYDALRPLMGRLEGTYDAVVRFCHANQLPITLPTKRLKVILYASHKDYQVFLKRVGVAQGSAAGVYDQRMNLSGFCDAMDSPTLKPLADEIKRLRQMLQKASGVGSNHPSRRRQQETIRYALSSLSIRRDVLVKRYNSLVIQHEAAHQILYNIGVHRRGSENPRWLVEGLACQFEVPQPVGIGAALRPNSVRLADLRAALDLPLGVKKVSPDRFQAALSQGRLSSLVDLISDPKAFQAGGDLILFRYAQAWGLVYDLNRNRPDDLAAYLILLSQREPRKAFTPRQSLAEFESIFGQVNDDFQIAWINRMARLRFAPP